MIVTSSESRISDLCAQWRTQGLSVGFVPTMGALHQGHLSLVEAAAASADRVVVSIFVNPTQFGQGEDLDMYPRTLENDCESVELLGASAVFTPDADVIYPTDFSTSVSVTGISEGLCGAFRPGHFDGVTTVCAVLFGIVRPDMAVFGMKDAQQLAV
ncbi:MAG: pantoate--beta-alanine ligase, partial [Candidatus Sabulitectum sp.]|nr:pantoate--beta-alanine ligase [Candidatus Sabulitectum sp.]